MDIKERLEVYFSLVSDSRHQSYITYKMSDLLLILFAAHVCGLRDEEEIADFAEERWEFFKKYISHHRPPCQSTICNILKILNPEQLELCFQGVVRNVAKIKIEIKKQIAIDGKTACGANSIHIVTALETDNCFSVGQMMVDEKTNEIPTVTELLDKIPVKNNTITFDAMHCQKDTLEKIIEKGGDYVVQVKRNQKTLYNDITDLFKQKEIIEKFAEVEKANGRISKRICEVLPYEYITDEYFGKWANIKRIFRIERQTEKNGKKTKEISYYISSLEESAKNLSQCVRKHWKIESFHWILDVVMGEDDAFVRNKNSQFCLNIIRKYAISFVKQYIEQEKPKKKSISGNMRKALFSCDFMANMLGFFIHYLLLQLCDFY